MRAPDAGRDRAGDEWRASRWLGWLLAGVLLCTAAWFVQARLRRATGERVGRSAMGALARHLERAGLLDTNVVAGSRVVIGGDEIATIRAVARVGGDSGGHVRVRIGGPDRRRSGAADTALIYVARFVDSSAAARFAAAGRYVAVSTPAASGGPVLIRLVPRVQAPAGDPHGAVFFDGRSRPVPLYLDHAADGSEGAPGRDSAGRPPGTS